MPLGVSLSWWYPCLGGFLRVHLRSCGCYGAEWVPTVPQGGGEQRAHGWSGCRRGQVWRAGPSGGTGGWGAWGEQRRGCGVLRGRLPQQAVCKTQLRAGTCGYPLHCKWLCLPLPPCPSPAITDDTLRPLSTWVPGSHRGASPTACSPLRTHPALGAAGAGAGTH